MESNIFWITLFSVLFIIFATAESEEGDDSDVAKTSKILDGLFKTYDKRVRPNFRNKPVDVKMTIYVLDIFNVDEIKHEFTVNMYFRHHWEDPRMVFKPLPNMDKILLDNEHAKKLWIPDTFMTNERKSQTHSVGASNEMTRISPNGNVLKSTRITVTAACKMDLGYFPFDNQLCSLDLESYGYTAADIVYSWKEGDRSVGVSQEVSSSSLKYSVTGIKTKTVVVTFDNVNYSRLGLEFYFERNAARYLQDAYFPAIVLTILAILTLYLGSLMARIQLSVLLTCVMMVFMSLNSTWMPRVSYQTALDFYIFMCANMVVNCVIVNFILHMYHKPSGRRPEPGMRRLEEMNNGIGGLGGEDNMKESLCDNENSSVPNLNTRVDVILYKIAKMSKYSIPIAFLAINVIYWMVILIGSSGFPEDFILVENRN